MSESKLEKKGERGSEERDDSASRGKLDVIYIVADFAEGKAEKSAIGKGGTRYNYQRINRKENETRIGQGERRCLDMRRKCEKRRRKEILQE